MTTRPKRPSKARPAAASVQNVVAEVKAAQVIDRVLMLSEYSESRPLTLQQIAVLRPQGERLQQMLGLKLLVDLDGRMTLKASQFVGTARFVHEGQHVLVEVRPKFRNADVMRMVDRSQNSLREHGEEGPLYGGDNITLVFLSYFARKMTNFLKKAPDRRYTFEQLNEPGKIKGRPLLGAYVRQSLPRARPHVMPCVYLNYHLDVFDNQVLAAAVNIALRLVRERVGNASNPLSHQLSSCARQLRGVAIHRISSQDVKRLVYNRTSARYQPIHALCAMILDHRSVALQTGERVPFFSFSIDMSSLFQSYVAAVFAQAFGYAFTSESRSLTFGFSQLDKDIILDGLLKVNQQVIVIECKYKNSFGDTSFGLKILNEDVFQALAYAGYQQIKAEKAILIYPIDDEAKPAVLQGKSLSDFGWRPQATTALPIDILGINLTHSFDAVVSGIKRQLSS